MYLEKNKLTKVDLKGIIANKINKIVTMKKPSIRKIVYKDGIMFTSDDLRKLFDLKENEMLSKILVTVNVMNNTILNLKYSTISKNTISNEWMILRIPEMIQHISMEDLNNYVKRRLGIRIDDENFSIYNMKERFYFLVDKVKVSELRDLNFDSVYGFFAVFARDSQKGTVTYLYVNDNVWDTPSLYTQFFKLMLKTCVKIRLPSVLIKNTLMTTDSLNLELLQEDFSAELTSSDDLYFPLVR